MKKYESFAYAHDIADAFYSGRIFYFDKGRITYKVIRESDYRKIPVVVY